MILTGHKIAAHVAAGDVTLDPFEPDHLNPNSCDLRLGNTLLVYADEVLDPRRPNSVRKLRIPRDGMRLRGGGFYLGSSVERVGSTKFAPIIHAKSGIARLGLFVHLTADLIDIGSIGNITFQLHPVVDIMVYAGMRIGQVSFWKPRGEIWLYNGKYQGSVGPQASKSYLGRVSPRSGDAPSNEAPPGRQGEALR